MQTANLEKYLLHLKLNQDPILTHWLEKQDFLNDYNSKLPAPLDANNALHHLYFIMYTELHWTAHNEDYHELERKLLQILLAEAITIDPTLSGFNDTNTPNILFNS
jgi:hypothetical protein